MDKIVKYELKLSIPSSQASQHLKKFENFIYKAINQGQGMKQTDVVSINCLLYTSPSPRDAHESRMPSSA
mgnify:CR=1 FL=1